MLYWIDATPDNKKIVRASIDGTGMQDVTWDLALDPMLMDIDTINDRIYWVYWPGFLGEKNIYWSSFDGTEWGSPVTDRNQLYGIALDNINGKMYWYEFIDPDRKILSADLDGNSQEDVFTRDTLEVYDIALDIEHNRIYWTEWNKINYVYFDSTDDQTIIDLPIGQDVQLYDFEVYDDCVYFFGWSVGIPLIRRSDLEGNNVETMVILGSNESLCGIALLTE